MEGIHTQIQIIQRESDRLRVRMYYLQRTARTLALQEWSVSSDDMARLEHALLTLNNLIDANVVYLARMGEFVSDAEGVWHGVLADPDNVTNGTVITALQEELVEAVAELHEQRRGLDESVHATRELVSYFLEDAAA